MVYIKMLIKNMYYSKDNAFKQQKNNLFQLLIR